MRCRSEAVSSLRAPLLAVAAVNFAPVSATDPVVVERGVGSPAGEAPGSGAEEPPPGSSSCNIALHVARCTLHCSTMQADRLRATRSALRLSLLPQRSR